MPTGRRISGCRKHGGNKWAWHILDMAFKRLERPELQTSCGKQSVFAFPTPEKKQISMQNVPNTKPNRTEIDQEPQEPKPNRNRTGPIPNTRNRNRTEPKPPCRRAFGCPLMVFRDVLTGWIWWTYAGNMSQMRQRPRSWLAAFGFCACGRNCCEILQHAELPGAPLWIQDDACQLLYKHRVAGSDFAERHSSWLCAFARDGRRQLVATSLCHVQPRNVFGWFIIATSTATGCSRTWTTNSDRGEGCCISEARRRMSTRVTV